MRGDVERLVHDLRQIRQVLDQVVVLGAGTGDAEGVGLLKGIASDQLGGDLAGDGDDGSGIHQGVDQTGDQVGGARDPEVAQQTPTLPVAMA